VQSKPRASARGDIAELAELVDPNQKQNENQKQKEHELNTPGSSNAGSYANTCAHPDSSLFIKINPKVNT
jgi:hypothetical protein